METYISGLSATQTNVRTHTLTHTWDKKNWFGSSAESKQQTLNVPFPIDEFLCQTSLLFKSSDTGCSSEECFFLLVLMSKMCPFSKGLFCKEGNNEASFYEKDRMFCKFESNIILSGTVDFPKHVAVLEKSAKAHCKVDGKRTYKAKSSVLFNPQMQTQRQQSSCISCFATAETQEKQGFAQGDVAQVPQYRHPGANRRNSYRDSSPWNAVQHQNRAEYLSCLLPNLYLPYLFLAIIFSQLASTFPLVQLLRNLAVRDQPEPSKNERASSISH